MGTISEADYYHTVFNCNTSNFYFQMGTGIIALREISLNCKFETVRIEDIRKNLILLRLLTARTTHLSLQLF